MTPKKRRARLLAYLAVLGPGLLAASAGNDAGGIATYAQAGAAYRYDLLWLLFLITFALIVVQEACARMGAVTGKGLSDLIRENFGVRWTILAMFALTIANFFVAAADIAGVAAALQMFGVSKFISVPLLAIGLWFLLVRGSYIVVEKGLLLFAALFLAYPIAAFTVHPNWAGAFHTMLVPSAAWLGRGSIGYISLAIGLIGTTIAPWMTFFLQSSVVDKGERKQDLPLRRFDVIFGAISADIVAFFIIVTTAVLYKGFGKVQFDNAAQAAKALQYLVHGAAPYLFGAGLFGASVLGAAAVPLTTSYAVTEAFGWERGLDHRFRQAPIFFGLFTSMLILGSLLVLVTPEGLLFELILKSQVVNGILVPIILVFIVLLSNNHRLMGDYTNSKVFNVIAWGTVILVTAMTLILFILQILGR
ncbi:MAG TPA: divalent metal cation transporter [Armatimonadota bacterium]|nr:divalent metal cation transporter [Armatimonadota bacterium]